MIGSGILTIILAGVVFNLSDRTRIEYVYKQLSITAEGIHDKIDSFLKMKKEEKRGCHTYFDVNFFRARQK